MTGPLGFPLRPPPSEWLSRPVHRPCPERRRGEGFPAPAAGEGSAQPAVHSPSQGPTTAQPVDREVSSVPLRVVMLYDMDACHGPTGVTRHALAQLERLSRREDVALRLISGRMTHPDGLAYWASLERSAADASCRSGPATSCGGGGSRPWPPIEWLSGPADWIYCPAEYAVPARQARMAVTSHDVLQHLRFQPPKNRELLASAFGKADLILSVSAVQHPPTDRGVSLVQGSRGPRSQCRGGPVLRAGQPAGARAGADRSGAAAPGCLISFPWRISSRGRTWCG